MVMKGYFNMPEATADAIDADGWLHTGDLATVDEDGYYKITGRLKDMIIRGGENIYPREIEEFLYTHPQIDDVQVVGVPDERFGEEVMAWVRLKPDADATEESIRDFCRGKIAHSQGAPLRQVHRRVPDDRHRQDPEVPDARAGSGRIGPANRRQRANRVNRVVCPSVTPSSYDANRRCNISKPPGSHDHQGGTCPCSPHGP